MPFSENFLASPAKPAASRLAVERAIRAALHQRRFKHCISGVSSIYQTSK